MKIVVYTALFGQRDKLWSAYPLALGGSEYVCFSDRPRQQIGLWSTDRKLLLGSERQAALPSWDVRVVPLKKTPRRTARYYKALPHRYFPDADVTIWVDANVRLLVTSQAAVKQWLGDAPLATFRHPDRKCLYQEASFCMRKKGSKGNKAALKRQVDAYLKEGMPRKWGLAETKCVIRRRTEALNEAWWDEMTKHSIRDQISLPYVCWKSGLRWRIIPGRAHWHPLRGQASKHFWLIQHIK